VLRKFILKTASVPSLNAYNTQTHKQGYTRTLELYSLTEVREFSTAIYEAPDNYHIGRNMQCSSDVKNNFKIKKIKC
jgi:hypothetical protein